MGDMLEISSTAIIGAVEFAGAIIALSLFLYFSQRKTKKKLQETEENSQKQIKSLKKKVAKPSQTPISFLKDELLRTKQRFLKIGKASKVTLSPTDKIKQQCLALRYYFLKTETKMLSSKPGNEKKYWAQIEKLLSSIAQTYLNAMEEANSSSEELKELQQKHDLLEAQNNNLQRYKKLFFDLQSQAQTSEEEIDHIHGKISDLISDSSMSDDQQEQVASLFNSYQESVGEVISSITTVAESSTDNGDEDDRTPKDTKIIEQFGKLKDIAIEQKNTISALRDRISDLKQSLNDGPPTDEEIALMITELETLNEDVARLERTLNDSEMCVQVLEADNDSLQQDILALKTECEQLKKQPIQSPEQIEAEAALQAQITNLSSTITEQQQQIANLEDDDSDLSLDLDEVKVEELAEKLDDKESRITELETLVGELEEKISEQQSALHAKPIVPEIATQTIESELEEEDDDDTDIDDLIDQAQDQPDEDEDDDGETDIDALLDQAQAQPDESEDDGDETDIDALLDQAQAQPDQNEDDDGDTDIDALLDQAQ
ncbi:MAG: hypothetical protein HOM11_01085, partial [Methylococcales bacterium]|nr:hypothetical protein [Methylococcales bacterium]